MTRARDLAAFVSNADGDIKFDTDTLFIDSSANKVGIGMTTPSADLTVTNGSNGGTLSIGDNASGSTSVRKIQFGESDDYSIQSNANSYMRFYAEGSEAMRINSSGEINIGTTSSLLSATNRANITLNGTSEGIINLGINGSQGGYLYQTATDLAVWNTKNGPLRFAANNAEVGRFLSGGGLTFNGDTAAANALDDYEEGVHDISFTMSSSGTVTAKTNFDRIGYTKIGRVVHVVGNPRIGSVSSPSGDLKMSLPFAAAGGAIDEKRAGCVINYYQSGVSNPYFDIPATIVENTSSLFIHNTDNNGSTFSPSANDELILNFFYFAAT